MWTDLSKWAKNFKILRSHIDVQQKVTLAEKKFNNQEDDGPILWTIGLFPQPSLLLFNGSMNEVAMVAEMEVIHGLSNMNVHSSRLTWLQLLLCAMSAKSRHQY